MQNSETSNRWGVGVLLLVIVLPLMIGSALSLLIPQPIIGVIYLNDAIYDFSARQMIAQIDYARQTPAVRAVVIVMNSPGGTVVDTESVYMELARLRQTKPVITIIEGMAASGGYYLSCGTDYIFAKPSSVVGNIGVIGYAPQSPMAIEDVYSSGPYKLWGSSRDSTMREVEMLKRGFLQVVQLGRGSRLAIPDEVILSGQVWSGVEARQLGLVDEFGPQSSAFEKAAQLARVSHYRTVDLSTQVQMPEAPGVFFMQAPNGTLTPYPNKEGIYLLYVPQTEKEVLP